MKHLILMFIVVFMFIGCEKRLTEGNIVEKQYEPERTWMAMTTIHNGKTMTQMPQYWYDDEDFIFIVEGFNEDNKLVRQSFYVSEDFYNEHEVGDFVHFWKDEMAYEDLEIKKD